MIELILGFIIGLSNVGSPDPADSNTNPIQEIKSLEQPTDLEEPQSDISPTSDKEVYQVFLDPLYRTRLYAEINIPIAKIYKRMGDSFNKGDKLLEFDNRVFQGAFWKAKATLEKAETEYEGKLKLYHDNITSLFELKEAEANVASAKADLITAQKNLDSSIIKAPYKGKVVMLYIEEHELPQQGKELIEIVDTEVLIAKLLLPSLLLTRLQKGQELTLHIKETGADVNAKITRISPVIDPSSSTIKVEAEIENSDNKLSAGMTGTVRIP